MRIAPMFGAGEVLSSPSLPLLLALLLLFGGLTPLQGQDELPKTIASDLSLPFDRTDLLEQGEFRRAWSLLPSDIRQWGSYDHLKRGESALYAGLVSQAVRTLREVIDDGANRSIQQRAALQIGRIELAAGAYPEARLTLNRLFSEDGREGGGANELPSDVAGEALFWIGVSHLLESRSAAVVQGQQMFDASAADHPWNPRADDALYYSGQLFEAEGRNDEALARYRRLSDRYPESPYRIAATLRQVQVLHQTRRFDEALVRLEEAEVLWDRSEEAGTTKSEHFSSLIPLELVRLRGEISIGRGDLAGSERAWLTLLHELDGGYRRVGRLALAETYRIAGAVDSAVALYNRIIAGTLWQEHHLLRRETCNKEGFPCIPRFA